MAAAALQQSPIAFRSRSPPSPQIQTNQTVKFSLSSSFKVARLLAAKPLRRRGGGGGRGASGARMANTAAESYAKALTDIAIANNTLAETTSDVERLVNNVFSEAAVLSYFTNPTIGDIAKREIVDELARSMKLQPHVANFLNILVDMKRIDLIKEILKEFEFIVNRLTDTEVATVTSVVELEPQQLAEISKQVRKLTGAKIVKINTEIDKSLVAGFTIRYGNSGSYFIDMSVKKQLQEIAEQLDLSDIQLAV